MNILFPFNRPYKGFPPTLTWRINLISSNTLSTTTKIFIH